MFKRCVRVFVVLALSGPVLGVSPARAETTKDNYFWFNVIGTAPCAVACSYWQFAQAVGYRPCENPFPETSYRDVITEPAPDPGEGRKVVLQVEIRPGYDWDTWICTLLANGSHNGAELAAGGNARGEPCRGEIQWPPQTGIPSPIPGGGIPYGCVERAETVVQPGQRVVIRGYNWSDIEDCPGTYHWTLLPKG